MVPSVYRNRSMRLPSNKSDSKSMTKDSPGFSFPLLMGKMDGTFFTTGKMRQLLVLVLVLILYVLFVVSRVFFAQY